MAIMFTCRDAHNSVCTWLDESIDAVQKLRCKITNGVLSGPFPPIPFHGDKLWFIFRMHGTSALVQLINLRFERRVWGLIFRLDTVMYGRLKTASALLNRSITQYQIYSDTDVHDPYQGIEDPSPASPFFSFSESGEESDGPPQHPMPYFDSYAV